MKPTWHAGWNVPSKKMPKLTAMMRRKKKAWTSKMAMNKPVAKTAKLMKTKINGRTSNSLGTRHSCHCYNAEQWSKGMNKFSLKDRQWPIAASMFLKHVLHTFWFFSFNLVPLLPIISDTSCCFNCSFKSTRTVVSMLLCEVLLWFFHVSRHILFLFVHAPQG